MKRMLPLGALALVSTLSSCSHSQTAMTRSPSSQVLESGSMAQEAWAAYEQRLHSKLSSPFFLQQDQRVNELKCETAVERANATYSGAREEFLTQSLSKQFPNLPVEVRRKFSSLFPKDLKAFKEFSSRADLVGPDTSILMAKFYRETGFNPFLDEAGVGSSMIRGGAGLVQITAWGIEDQKAWGPHDYDLYRMAREKNPSKEGVLAQVPSEIRVETIKKNIRTERDFIESPYNPLVSIWYGRVQAVDVSLKQLSDIGLDVDHFSAQDRAALVGAVYNGGISRVRCGVERLKLWNTSEKEDMPSDWASLRKLLYLDTSTLNAVGFSKVQIDRLKVGCGALSVQECSCLDQEDKARSKPSPLDGRDFKAAVMISYGNHMSGLLSCFEAL